MIFDELVRARRVFMFKSESKFLSKTKPKTKPVSGYTNTVTQTHQFPKILALESMPDF